MSDLGVFVGQQQLSDNLDGIQGQYIQTEGEAFYKISNYDRMPPFFMSVVSHADHWMFI